MPTRIVPSLERVDKRSVISAEHRKVVLIHGMASSSATAFPVLLRNLEKVDQQRSFDLWAFDYDSGQTFAESADQLVRAINPPFENFEVDLVGHSMGGLVARMAVLRHQLPNVRRIVTLATPNHGAINGTQLNFMGQLAALATRKIYPIYVRRPGVFDLVNAHEIMKQALVDMGKNDPSKLDKKSYASIPAQYFHSKRQLGNPSPSMVMGGTALTIAVLNKILRQRLITLTPVHDGIVEERSNQLSPAPVGSTCEGSFMPTRQDAAERMLHVTHEAAADHDHITINSCAEIADLIRAVLVAAQLNEACLDAAMPRGDARRVQVRPIVT